MDGSEKTVALKKAYAETILNTAKEASARVMMSERKSLLIHQDLNSTKEEAIQLLLRMKQMIDSKTTAAEISSSNQQGRIDLLEAQLHEAEDIITDLRTELKWARDNLENMKSNQGGVINAKTIKEDVYSYQIGAIEPIIATSTDSGLVTPINSNQTPEDNIRCNRSTQLEELSVSNSERCYADMPDLPSLNIGIKEHELYRNGCRQRIRALDRNLPPESVDHLKSLTNNNLVTKTSVQGDEKCTVPLLEAKNMDMMKNFYGKGLRKHLRIYISRIRKPRFGKARAISRRSRPFQQLKSCQSSSVYSLCNTFSVNGSNKALRTQISIKTDKTGMPIRSRRLVEQLHKSQFYNYKAILGKEKRNKKVKSIDSNTSSPMPSDNLSEPSQLYTVHTNRKTSNLMCVDVKPSEDIVNVSETNADIKLLPHLDSEWTPIKRDHGPTALNTSRVSQTNLVKETQVGDDKLLVTAGVDSVENSMVSSPSMNRERVNVPVVNSDLKDTKTYEETNKSPGKAENNRLFKYTFHRKRKKESCCDADEDNSLEKGSKKRTAAKQNDVDCQLTEAGHKENLMMNCS